MLTLRTECYSQRHASVNYEHTRRKVKATAPRQTIYLIPLHPNVQSPGKSRSGRCQAVYMLLLQQQYSRLCFHTQLF